MLLQKVVTKEQPDVALLPCCVLCKLASGFHGERRKISYHFLFQVMLFRLFLPLKNYLDYLYTIYQLNLILDRNCCFFSASFLYVPSIILSSLVFAAFCDVQLKISAAGWCLLHFPGENTCKKNQPSHFYLSYPKLLLAVQYVICLCNAVLRFPVYTGYIPVYPSGAGGGEAYPGAEQQPGTGRQLGWEQPEGFPGKQPAAARAASRAAGGHKDAGDATKLPLWVAEDWREMAPTRPTPYDHNAC